MMKVMRDGYFWNFTVLLHVLPLVSLAFHKRQYKFGCNYNTRVDDKTNLPSKLPANLIRFSEESLLSCCTKMNIKNNITTAVFY